MSLWELKASAAPMQAVSRHGYFPCANEQLVSNKRAEGVSGGDF
jgi:hypothetical protein